MQPERSAPAAPETAADAATARWGWAQAAGILGALGALIAVVLGLRSMMPVQQDAPLPDLTEIQEPQALREAFFAYLYPLVLDANLRVARERARLQVVERRYRELGGVRRSDREWLDEQRLRYRVSPDLPDGEALHLLMRRMDTLPESLVLAQAALESGWGTSRFAREGNNLFGQRCFSAGCGLVPAARRADERHEVAAYASVVEGIEAYVFNLNTHDAYRELRTLRAAARAQGRTATGLELAAALQRYSERGEPYVRDVQRIIRGNGLDREG